ncbi:MAG: 6-carboxytetrahydropterin synthase [Bdellovibrionota bacterium]
MSENPILSITKQISFEAGHRLPNHNSKCKNLHGHHYVVEFTITGNIQSTAGASDQGMIVDFSDVKLIADDVIKKPWDHAFFVFKHDRVLVDFLNSLDGHKTVITEHPPTAEHLAEVAYSKLSHAIRKFYTDRRVVLGCLRLYETPTSWAEVVASSV